MERDDFPCQPLERGDSACQTLGRGDFAVDFALVHKNYPASYYVCTDIVHKLAILSLSVIFRESQFWYFVYMMYFEIY